MTIGLVGVVMGVNQGSLLGIYPAIGFSLGLSSPAPPAIGMHISVRANVRTADAARTGRSSTCPYRGIKSGAVTGMLVVGFGLLGVAGYYMILRDIYNPGDEGGLRHILESLVAFGFGASLISIFMQLGGGIFTKGADVGE